MIRATLRRCLAHARTTRDIVRSRRTTADIALFFDFQPAPYGGGNQFLTALRGELERRGYRVEVNQISPVTRACLYTSFNFDFDRLRRFARRGCRMVHRVDGPVSRYRGGDEAIDRRIAGINDALADATIVQSQYSLDAHAAMGIHFKAPRVVHNAADPAIFHARGRVPFTRDRRVRLISTSWSPNPNKGAAFYAWLASVLDPQRFEYTFVGRSPVPLGRIRVLDPQPSAALADLLRGHDIFVTASLHESCSNALIEALSCGLPALYLDSGAQAELAGGAGLGFTAHEDAPALLDRIVADYDRFQQAIEAPPLTRVADAYLETMCLPPAA